METITTCKWLILQVASWTAKVEMKSLGKEQNGSELWTEMRI